MEYSVKQLCEIVGISEQTFYKLLNKNSDFSKIVEDNSHQTGKNKKRLYGEKCLEWLSKHYNLRLVEDGVGQSKPESENSKSPITTSPTSQPIEKHLELDLETYAEQLENKVARQKKRIKRLKAENERLIAENERLLTLLEQGQKHLEGVIVGFIAEKKEKHILLENPDKKKKHWRLWKKGE